MLLTHHHHPDHALEPDELASRFDAPMMAHAKAAEILGRVVDDPFSDGDVIETSGLWIEVVHTPRHCADHCAVNANGTDALAADVLFKGTVGGGRRPARPGWTI